MVVVEVTEEQKKDIGNNASKILRYAGKFAEEADQMYEKNATVDHDRIKHMRKALNKLLEEGGYVMHMLNEMWEEEGEAI